MTRSVLIVLATLLLASCGQSTKVQRQDSFTPQPEQQKLYVVPFIRVMVPWEVNEEVFDYFVDALNASALPRDYQFAILKTPLAQIDPQWLNQQYYVSGELFGYRQDSGCCSTVLQLTGRVRFHQPNDDKPSLEIEYPGEIFFEHDYSSLDKERHKLAEQIAKQLAEQFIEAIFTP